MEFQLGQSRVFTGPNIPGPKITTEDLMRYNLEDVELAQIDELDQITQYHSRVSNLVVKNEQLFLIFSVLTQLNEDGTVKAKFENSKLVIDLARHHSMLFQSTEQGKAVLFSGGDISIFLKLPTLN